MASNEIHVGDVGLSFEITVQDQSSTPIDLSTTTVREFHFKKPNGTILILPASFLTDGTDGILKYVFQDGDIDLDGNWKYQAMFEFGISRFWTDIGKFKVFPNLS